MGFLGSTHLDEPWVFGATSQADPVSAGTTNNPRVPADVKELNTGARITGALPRQNEVPEPERSIPCPNPLDVPQDQHENPNQSDDEHRSPIVSNIPQAHLDAFAAGEEIFYPSNSVEKKAFLRKFFRVVWAAMWGRSTVI